ncbi:MAG: ribonuclease P protein component [Pseudomonadota bacterium]|nr:ribonuclease P protein component [Pseudomonadota bacterium]
MSTGRFARHQRLLTSSDFRDVFAHPRRFSHPHLMMLARSNQKPYARLGLAIPKRHIRLAVDRNRIKRQIRESFRARQTKLVGWDIVVMARSGAARLSNRELREVLESHWQRLATECADS